MFPTQNKQNGEKKHKYFVQRFNANTLTGFSFAIVVMYFFLFLCFSWLLFAFVSIFYEYIFNSFLCYLHLQLNCTIFIVYYIYMYNIFDQWMLRRLLGLFFLMLYTIRNWNVKYVKCIRKYVCRSYSSIPFFFVFIYRITRALVQPQFRFISWG